MSRAAHRDLAQLVTGGAATGLSWLAVATNANRLGRFNPPSLPSEATAREVDPIVEVGPHDAGPDEPEQMRDPVCHDR